MAFITEMPNRPMKPMAAETLSGVPVRVRAKMPPIMAMGSTLAARRVSVRREKLTNSKSRISARLTGIASPNRFSAFCRSPSSPTHSILYPVGSGAALATRRWASSTAPPRSRPRTLNLIGI